MLAELLYIKALIAISSQLQTKSLILLLYITLQQFKANTEEFTETSTG